MRARGGLCAAGRAQGTGAAALPALLLLAACQREARDLAAAPFPESAPAAAASAQQPGDMRPPAQDPRGREYEGNAYDIAQGAQLFNWFNCNGCHFNGGGGIGPALMDSRWRYGGSIEQIYQSIAQGRPNGMPSWGAKIPPRQIWQIAAYVRSLSSNVRKSAIPARMDTITATPPGNQVRPSPPVWGVPKPVHWP